MKYLFLILFLLISLKAEVINFDKSAMLQGHNEERARVGVSGLVWSNTLENIALNWAKKLANSGCRMKHSSSSSGYGENLYWASALIWSNGKKELQNISSLKVLRDWAEEKRDYNYQSNTCRRGKVCGHYTQIVWRSTKEVGCAAVICPDKSQIWVCNYSPAGNYMYQKPY